MDKIKEMIRQIAFERQYGESVRNIKEYIRLVEDITVPKSHGTPYIKNRYYAGNQKEISFEYTFEWKGDNVYLNFDLKNHNDKLNDKIYYSYYYTWDCFYKGKFKRMKFLKEIY